MQKASSCWNASESNSHLPVVQSTKADRLRDRQFDRAVFFVQPSEKTVAPSCSCVMASCTAATFQMSYCSAMEDRAKAVCTEKLVGSS